MADWQEDSGSSIELSDSDLEESGLGRQVLQILWSLFLATCGTFFLCVNSRLDADITENMTARS